MGTPELPRALPLMATRARHARGQWDRANPADSFDPLDVGGQMPYGAKAWNSGQKGVRET